LTHIVQLFKIITLPLWKYGFDFLVDVTRPGATFSFT